MGAERHPTWPAVERGDGSPVVFLHGYPLSHAIWEPQLELSFPGRCVALLDLPGYGLAQDWPVPESLSGFADSVHRTLARRFSVPIVLVGHSFGGYIALQLVRDHPEQFEALVLTNTRSEPDTAEAREKRLATARRLGNSTQSLDVDQTTRALLAPGTWNAGGPVVEKVRGIVRSVPSRTIISTLHAIAGRPDLTPILSTIAVPTLVLWGEDDQLIPPAQSHAMVARVRGGSGLGIPGAGHLPSLETPESFARPLGSFVARLPTP